jgi:pimeloyl-ACP methyl ester carboxylesterase
MEKGTLLTQAGHEIAYLRSEATEGAVLFVPGFSLASWDWLPVTEHLGGRSWLAIDLPGHGRSAHQELYSLERDADAVVALIQAVGAPVVLVGHSRGGMVSGVVASRRPELVRGVYYEDVTPLFATSPLTKTHVVMESVFGLGTVVAQLRAEGRDADWLADQLAVRLHDDTRTYGEVLPSSALASWADQLMDVDVDMFGSKVERVRTVLSPAEQVAAYSGPVHVGYGELELGSIVLPSELDEMRGLAPRLSSTALSGTGHFIHAQAPERFGDDLCAFLAANDL